MEVARADIAGLVWLRVPRGYQLAVKLKAGSKVKFSGFREQVRSHESRHSVLTRFQSSRPGDSVGLPAGSIVAGSAPGSVRS